MAERFTPLFRFGVFNPTHFIIAVLDDEASAEQAAAALGDAGFPPDDVAVADGDRVLAAEISYRDQRGVLARLAGLFPAEEQAAVNDYMKEAERGAFFLAVKAPEHEQRTRARSILAANGAHAMRYYGENTVTDL